MPNEKKETPKIELSPAAWAIIDNPTREGIIQLINSAYILGKQDGWDACRASFERTQDYIQRSKQRAQMAKYATDKNDLPNF